MKMKKLLAIVLALAVMLSVLLGIPVQAATGTVVKNTGVRHTVCTSLSSQALEYYSDNDALYDDISILTGGSTNCLTTVDSALYNELQSLMSSTMTSSSSYSNLTSKWPKTDANNGSSTQVLFYSDVVSSSNISREHVWPKSHASFYESGGGSDPHHLRPEDSTINSTRSNYCMGNVRENVSGYKSKEYDGNVVLYYGDSMVEVNDNIKGDVARIFLYVYCRWEEPNLFMDTPNPVIGSGDNQNTGEKVIESLDTLLEWCEMDPVDTWEMSRNDQCENWVGNRNVFIDYPEYAWLLFGLDVPDDMVTPSGEASEGTSGSGSGSGSTTCTHTSTDYVSVNDTTHSIVCLSCSATVSTASHTLTNNVCTLCGFVKTESTVSGTVTYTFSDYAAGTQYAANEQHVLDDTVTVTTNKAYFTEQLRLYDSSTYDSTAIISSSKVISGLSLNVGNASASLLVYGSTDGVTYTLIDTLTTASSYKDFAVSIDGSEGYKYIKLDASGAQVRIKSATITFADNCDHEYTSTRVEPTCSTIGYITSTCSICGVTTTEVLEKLAHTLTSTRIEPTCAAEGSVTSICSVCGYEATEVLQKLEHTNLSYAYANNLYHSVTCNDCGTNVGNKTHTFTGNLCSLCKYTKPAVDNVVFELGDDGSASHSDGSSGSTYTETVGDYTLSITSGTKMYTGAIDATGNGCIKLGTSSATGSFTFTVPDDVTSVVIKVAGYKASTVTVTANGTSTAITTKSANGEYTDITVDTSSTKTVTFATSTGKRAMINSITYNVESAEHEHVYTSATTAATCTENGKIVYTCSCGDTYEEIIEATGHTAGDWEVVTEATTSADGLKARKCTVCGETLEEKVIPRVLTFASKTLGLKSNIALIFRVDPVYLTNHGYTNLSVVFNFNNKEYVVTDYTVNTSGLYEYRFSDAGPHQMLDNVTAVIKAEFEGEVYTSEPLVYSIATYCTTQINALQSYSQMSKLVGLLVDMLNYGAAAQQFNSYNTSNLANASLTEKQLAFGNQDVLSYEDMKDMQYATVENSVATFDTVALAIKDSIAVSFKFTMAAGQSIDGLVVRFEAAGKSWDIPASEFTYESANNRYVATIREINPSQMKERILATLYKDGVIVSDTASYSIESYGASTAMSIPTVKTLVEAMVRYGRSAKAYNG